LIVTFGRGWTFETWVPGAGMMFGSFWLATEMQIVALRL
jgi:hypothetical protein